MPKAKKLRILSVEDKVSYYAAKTDWNLGDISSSRISEIESYLGQSVYDFNDFELLYKAYEDLFSLRNVEPVKISDTLWVFNNIQYQIQGVYDDDQARLLILEEFDKERRLFERLKMKFEEKETSETTYKSYRIPERVRVEVWRRDSGKCARCGSREKLEYDHIVPISKGGSNTARNIELLCEKHNRSKSNNVV
jgi:hypothetical protein